MGTQLRFLVAVLLICLFSGSSLAGDFATLNFIGFSKDGRYLAFEEYGTQDASGYPFSNIYFIDTGKNSMASPRVAVLIEKESAAESNARSRSAALAARKLRQFGIIRGNTGRLMVSHPMTDQTYDDGSGTETGDVVKFAEQVWSMHREGDYELTLNAVPVKSKECEVYGIDTFMTEVSLKDNVNDTSRILQKDTSLPASRGCAMSYRIQDVYLYKGTLAVFAGVFSLGWEGPDMRFMAVTGKLK